MIFIVGTGIGDLKDLSCKVIDILESAEFIAGFEHSFSILKGLSLRAQLCELDIRKALKEDSIAKLVSRLRSYRTSVLLVSGNPLLFSYARKIMQRLYVGEFEVIPAVSSVVYLASRLGVDVNDICMVSGHNSHDLISSHAKVLFLLQEGCVVGYFVKNEDDYKGLLSVLAKRNVRVYMGFELGTSEEFVYSFRPSEGNPGYLGGRCVLIIKAEDLALNPFPCNRNLGFEGIPISREWSRSLVVHALDPQKGDVVWDVGAGSGATSIWLSSLVGWSGKVYAVEKVKQRFDMLRENVFPYPNIIPVFGDICEVLQKLPLPKAVHIGGGITKDMLWGIFSKCGKGTRFVAAITTVDSLVEFSSLLDKISFEVEMYARFSSKSLGVKRGFVGEHVLYLLRGVVL